MKSIQVTRKVKQDITDHFTSGGTKESLPDELKRAGQAAIDECWNFHEGKKIKRGQFTTQVPPDDTAAGTS
jgi:hypothetical protein